MEMSGNCFLKHGAVATLSPSPSLAILIHCMGCQISNSLYIEAYTFYIRGAFRNVLKIYPWAFSRKWLAAFTC